MKPKIPAADLRSNLDKFVDDFDNLPACASATRIEMESAPGSTSSSVAATSPGLDLFQSRDLHSRSQLGSCKPTTDLQEANISGSLSMSGGFLLQDGKPEATACRGASGCSGTGALVITSLPEEMRFPRRSRWQRRGARQRGGSRRGGGPSSGLIAAAG
jgi:hypothetical protein